MSNLWVEVLISYDITENKVRKRFYDFLLDMGLKPIQKSLFWGIILRPELKDIQDRINFEHLKIGEDDKILITKVNLLSDITYTHGHIKEEFKIREIQIV